MNIHQKFIEAFRAPMDGGLAGVTAQHIGMANMANISVVNVAPPPPPPVLVVGHTAVTEQDVRRLKEVLAFIDFALASDERFRELWTAHKVAKKLEDTGP